MSNISFWWALPLTALCAWSSDPSPSPSTCAPSQVELLKAHYAAAEQELLGRDISSMAPEQRERRARLIEALRAYRERGQFGRNPDSSVERAPIFVDEGGRRCAVAELLHSTGEDELVARVRAGRNSAWILDLAGDRQFSAWLEHNGLTLDEAARIQAPGPGSRGRRPSDVPPSGPSPDAGPIASAPRGSGANPAPIGTGSSAGAFPSGPASGGPTSGAPATGGAQSPRSGVDLNPLSTTAQMDEFGTWATWWEYNKLEYLKPNQLSLWSFPATGDHLKAGFEQQLAAMRKSLVPLLVGVLADKDPNVRAAGAVSLGRIGGEEVVAHVRGLLDDPNLAVRHHAILALGATGSAEAAVLLLSIAEHGSVDAESRERISRQAPALAIVALGLVRQEINDPSLDEAVARIARARRGEDKNLVEAAAFMYETLAPCPELEAFALEVAQQKNGDPNARSRAVECLRKTQEPDTLSKLQHILSGARLDLRRSAALAMGGVRNPLALPPLMTAYELESEPLTKSFLLISIGQQGGDAAREFLLKTLERGDQGQRRWCALALGIAVRAQGDATVADAIRAAGARERSHEAQAAYWIAGGLARDAKAVPVIRDALYRATDPQQRMYAATALALIGGDVAITALRERRTIDGSALVQVAIAQALGYLGESSDAPALLDTLSHLRDPELQSLAAVALAFHGSSAALRGLSEVARMDSGSSVRRAAAIDGLGMLLGKQAPLELSEISRSSNFTLFSDFEDDLFQVTL